MLLSVFGSAQLIGHKYIRPKAIHDNDVIEQYAKDYMYLSYIQYINSVRLTFALCVLTKAGEAHALALVCPCLD